MKKILIGYIGLGKTSGIDKYLFSFADQMIKEGNKIDFLTRYNEADLQDISIKYNCKIHKISRNRHFFKQLKEMRKIIKNNNYDIAYFNISESTNCIGILASKLFGIKKIVVHSHSAGVENHSFFKRLCLKTLNFLFKPIISICSDLNITCSDKAAKWLFTKNVYDNNDYYMIYNAVSYDRFKYNPEIREKIRKDLNIDNKFVIGHIGRFSYQKNHKFLLDTFAEYLKINNNSVLICIGNGEDFEKIEEYSKKIGVYEKIIFTKEIDNVNEYIQAFDCFLLPSRFEGLPIVGVEAQISQTKCIFSSKITKMCLISNDNIFLPIKSPKLWAKNISSKITELDKNSEKFKLENCNEQFNIITNEVSGKKYTKFLILKALLVIHYMLNLTVFANGFNYIMYACGALILGIVLSSGFKFFNVKKEYKQIFLYFFLFLISCTVSSFFLNKYDVISSVKTIIWTSLHMFFIFNASYFKNSNDLKKEIYTLSKLIVLIVSLINIQNICLLLKFYSSNAYDFEGKLHLIGLSKWGRFFGNYYDANYGSIASVIAIFMGIYLLKTFNSKANKFVCLTTIFIQIIYIIFSQSRTGLYSLAFGMICLSFIRYILENIRVKNFVTSILVILLLVSIVPKYSLKIYNKVYNNHISAKKNTNTNQKTTNLSKTNNIETNNVPSQVITTEKVDSSKENEKFTNATVTKSSSKDLSEDIKVIGRDDYTNDVSNGRFSIWKNGYILFKSHPLIGIGFNNIYQYSLEYEPHSYIATHKINAMHNTFIDITVSQGIFGLICFMLIFINVATRCLPKCKKILSSENEYLYSIILTIICSLAFSSLFISQIFYVNNFGTYIFWLTIGYLYIISKKEVQHE